MEQRTQKRTAQSTSYTSKNSMYSGRFSLPGDIKAQRIVADLLKGQFRVSCDLLLGEVSKESTQPLRKLGLFEWLLGKKQATPTIKPAPIADILSFNLKPITVSGEVDIASVMEQEQLLEKRIFSELKTLPPFNSNANFRVSVKIVY